MRLAFLGNHLPRHCGIATFTTHLADACAEALPGADCFVVAMNDSGHRYAYPERVRFEIPEADLAAYHRAADFLHVNQVDVLSVQHEYGIFGGPAGSHVLALLRALRMPVVTTLHTVLSAPDHAQRAVIDELARLSDRLVVMSRSGADLLMSVHGIRADQIDLIPHGIPRVTIDGTCKARKGVGGKTVIMTFGLLSRDKGIEYVIDALPAILSVHPDAVYLVLGATHPHVVEHEGETYRLMLESRARHLGVAEHVIFHNRFVAQDELTDYLSATDIYITPYLQPEQITSGTLAYAVGAGKAVVSTPYIYARELLADDRGVLVPWRDAASVARTVIDLIGDDARRTAMCARAAAYGVNMSWSSVGAGYADTFVRVRREHDRRLRPEAAPVGAPSRPLPHVSLRHVQALTDDTGMLQHAVFQVPRYDDGYCLDDNARALLLMARLAETGSDDPGVVAALAVRYLAFVNHAFDRTSGRFRNFMSYGRQWLESRGSEDSHARALWALGTVVGRATAPARQSLAGELFLAALPAATASTSPRAWAYTLLGLDEYLRLFEGDTQVEHHRDELADRLFGLFERTNTPDWPWFERSATYCNARLSQALIVSGARMGRPQMVAAGTRSLAWLVAVQSSPERHFAAIGCNGFFAHGAPRALFDQQPVEACTVVSACLDAHRVSGHPEWLAHARWAFTWFLGGNHLGHWLFDVATGGCQDGLHGERPNLNQGAEATLSCLMALQELHAVTTTDACTEPSQELAPTL